MPCELGWLTPCFRSRPTILSIVVPQCEINESAFHQSFLWGFKSIVVLQREARENECTEKNDVRLSITFHFGGWQKREDERSMPSDAHTCDQMLRFQVSSIAQSIRYSSVWAIWLSGKKNVEGWSFAQGGEGRGEEEQSRERQDETWVILRVIWSR